MHAGINRMKTWILIAALGGLFVLIGQWLGGTSGAVVALGFALVFNFSMYWFSDKIAIATTRSKPVTEQEYPQLYRIVRELAQLEQMPMPKIFVSDMMQPNAFATGRSPQHASVAVTKGILQILDDRELRGVLAHELSHVRNRDILIGSVAAAIGMSITLLARFAFFFGGSDDNRGGNAFGLLFAWILAPIAAAIIQMAVSRSREYQADESGAYLSRDPAALASALRKLEVTTKQVPAPSTLSPAEAHLFIMNPLAGRRGSGFGSLFSTHPPTEQRIERLQAIARELGTQIA
ncbi:MAG: zinc metalloprotease HtpX [Actinomycetota bacterium]